MKPEKPEGSIFLKIAMGLTLILLAAFLLAGPGSRLGWWHFRTGFTILKYGFYGAIFSLVILVIGLYRSRATAFSKHLARAVPALLILTALILIPVKLIRSASYYPRIHDITTDFDNPPPFRSILPLRKDAPNSAVYGGVETAALQKKGYPDLKPLFLPIPSDQAFQKALMGAEKLGWQIVEADPAENRIEATDTTFWFGFKDDIVIRVTPSEGGSRIDLRSLSRVGISDVGTNARRIRCFLDRLSMKE